MLRKNVWGKKRCQINLGGSSELQRPYPAAPSLMLLRKSSPGSTCAHLPQDTSNLSGVAGVSMFHVWPGAGCLVVQSFSRGNAPERSHGNARKRGIPSQALPHPPGRGPSVLAEVVQRGCKAQRIFSWVRRPSVEMSCSPIEALSSPPLSGPR